MRNKPLAQTTWGELQEQMSIAGNPEKIMGMVDEISVVVAKYVNVGSEVAELINAELVLLRFAAELKQMQRYKLNRERRARNREV